jgi:hypothetical protein
MPKRQSGNYSSRSAPARSEGCSLDAFEAAIAGGVYDAGVEALTAESFRASAPWRTSQLR